MDKLLIKTYEKEGMHGDRAVNLSPYKDYQLILVRDGEEIELVYINGYDNWWTHIRNTRTVLDELGESVNKFEKIFSVKATGVTLVKKVTVTEEWVEV